MAVIQFVNNCGTAQTVTVLPNGLPPAISQPVPPGTSSLFLPFTLTATVIDASGRMISFTFRPLFTGTFTLFFSTIDGACVMGTGSALLTITNRCTAATATLDEDPATTEDVTIVTPLPVGVTTTIPIRAGFTYDVCAAGSCLFAIEPTNNLILFPNGAGGCTLGLAPTSPGTITIASQCRFPALATVREIIGGVVVAQLPITVPAGATVTYTAVTGATMFQVCVMGRCVTVPPGGLVTLTEASGFCAPVVGAPVRCPAPVCRTRGPVRC